MDQLRKVSMTRSKGKQAITLKFMCLQSRISDKQCLAFTQLKISM